MLKVAKKTVSIRLDIFPCGNAKTTTNLTITCPEQGARFRTTLSEYGLEKFKQAILDIYKRNIRSAVNV